MTLNKYNDVVLFWFNYYNFSGFVHVYTVQLPTLYCNVSYNLSAVM